MQPEKNMSKIYWAENAMTVVHDNVHVLIPHEKYFEEKVGSVALEGLRYYCIRAHPR
jgi:hypothetical protein